MRFTFIYESEMVMVPLARAIGPFLWPYLTHPTHIESFPFPFLFLNLWNPYALVSLSGGALLYRPL